MPGSRRDVLRGDADGRAMEDMEYARAENEARESDRDYDRAQTLRSRQKAQLRNWEASERGYRMDEARGGFVGLEDANTKEGAERVRRNRELRNLLDRNLPDPTQKGFKRPEMKKGGVVKKMASGGAVKSSASSRADGCAARGKTKGRMV
jgi:hypothetical protein